MNGESPQWACLISFRRSIYLIWMARITGILLGISLLCPLSTRSDGLTFGARHTFGGHGAVVTGDMDGDGDLDIVAGSGGVYLNDGAGHFDWPGAIRYFGGSGSVAIGDMDNDGDLDIIAGSGEVHLNDGSGHFDWPGAIRSFGESIAVAVGDIDNDGDLDIITGNHEENIIYLNDGSGNFNNSTSFGTGDDVTNSVAVADLDGDGDLDIVAGNGSRTVWNAPSHNSVVYLNKGDGTFPGADAIVLNDFIRRNTRSVAVGDINGDGYLDIVLGNAPRYFEESTGPIWIGGDNVIYLNEGGLGYSDPQPFGGNMWTSSVAVGDLDGDGDLDVIAGNRRFVDPYNYATHSGMNGIYLNDGDAGLDYTSLGSELDYTEGMAMADVDGNSALDIIVSNSGQSYIYLNNATMGFLLGYTLGKGPISGATRGIAMGDMDGDGDLDVVVGTEPYLHPFYHLEGGQDWVMLNDGTGYISDRRPFGPLGSQRELGLSYSVGLGDIDNDGDLDIIAVDPEGPGTVYLNDGSANFATGPVDCAAEGIRCFGSAMHWAAPGDVDNDGDLDIVADSGKIYLNDGTGNFDWPAAIREFGGSGAATIGDMDNDGDLDIATPSGAVYLNDGAGNFDWPGAIRSFPGGWPIALGDVDSDGDLDIVAGSSGGNVVYLNSGASFAESRYLGGTEANATDIAIGDVDGDGDLDVVAGNYWSKVRVYLNNGQGIFSEQSFGTDSYVTTSIALGDIDRDGYLDIWVGSGVIHHRYYDELLPDQVYLNGLTRSARLPDNPPTISVTRPGCTRDADFYSAPGILGPRIPITYTLFDPEGDSIEFVRAFYSLDGGGRWYSAVAASGTVTTNLSTSGSALRFDGVDDYVEVPHSDALDITGSLTLEAWVNLSNPSNDQKIVGKSPIGSGYVLGAVENQLYAEIWDASGINHVIRAGNIPPNQWTHLAVTWQTGGSMIGFINGTPVMTVTTSGNPIGANTNVLRIGCAPWSGHHHTAGIIDDVRLYTRALSASEIRTTMFRMANGNESDLAGYWALNEGRGTIAHNLAPNHNDGLLINGPSWDGGRVPASTSYVYNWDVLASGFFGQSDDVVFRIEAYPGSLPRPSGVPGPYQRPYVSATTFPFRVSGSRVRILSGTVPVSDAMVYRLPLSQTLGAQPYASLSGAPFRTDLQGYLQGRGEIRPGDQLIALLPITHTETYTLYYTSAAPTPTGLNAYTVTAPGVQTLTVSSANPLVLFNPNVSLEWDARCDERFMSQLRFDLQRTSELLYDWTNGQAALGQVTIYQNREHWLDAHIRIYATNRMRPNAAQGGLVSQVITDPLRSDVIYAPGQVRIGAVWNRYGESSGTLGEDWPRALAHELGHYLLFLDDNYLGLDTNRFLIPISTCTGTAMSDPYREDYSEFHSDIGWLPDCERTLSHQVTGRSDWATITTFYPALNGTVENPGPSRLPLALPQIRVVEPSVLSDTLVVPVFYLSRIEGGRYQPGNSARAFLFQNDWITDLGRPTVDQVLARGARQGDRVCVYELVAGRLGCETVNPTNQQLEMAYLHAWQPQVIVSPVTSRTIIITVTNVPAGLSLEARLFPADDPAPGSIVLTPVTGGYAGIFNTDEPATAGYVHVWVNEPDPRREIVTDYALGGGPAFFRGRGAFFRGRGAFFRGRGAPAISADGQVTLFGDALNFQEGEFYVLQAATVVPSPPAWATVIGQAYWLSASANAPNLEGASISFSYLGSEVPPGEEQWIRIYFWDGARWQPLQTRLDTVHNNASTATRGPGLYALMSSIEIRLAGPGWNMFAYPVLETRPVTQALLSISGFYTTVYDYDATDITDPWKVYDVTAPGWVNDLDALRFGRGYWINVSQAITLYLKGTPSQLETMIAGMSSPPSPPATYYGLVLPGPDFVPATSTPVVAWVQGHYCGQGQTREVNDQIVYVVDVFADNGADHQGCGAYGRQVLFKVGLRTMMPLVTWQNNCLWNLSLQPSWQAYLPIVVRRQ